MVNAVKDEIEGTQGGVSYINEYEQVLVPVDRPSYLAGTYSRYFEFEFQGAIIGPGVGTFSRGVTPGNDEATIALVPANILAHDRIVRL